VRKLRIGGFFGYELERGEDERARGRERGENFIRTVIRRELIYPSLLWGRKLRRDPARQSRIETLHPAEFAWGGSSPRRKFSETFQLDALSEELSRLFNKNSARMRPVRPHCDVSRLIANRRASFRGNPALIRRDETRRRIPSAGAFTQFSLRGRSRFRARRDMKRGEENRDGYRFSASRIRFLIVLPSASRFAFA